MLKNIQVTGNKDTRSGFGDGILEAARKNPNIVALTADLAGSLKLNGLIKEFPERFIQCGIVDSIHIFIGLKDCKQKKKRAKVCLDKPMIEMPYHLSNPNHPQAQTEGH